VDEKVERIANEIKKQDIALGDMVHVYFKKEGAAETIAGEFKRMVGSEITLDRGADFKINAEDIISIENRDPHKMSKNKPDSYGTGM